MNLCMYGNDDRHHDQDGMCMMMVMSLPHRDYAGYYGVKENSTFMVFQPWSRIRHMRSHTNTPMHSHVKAHGRSHNEAQIRSHIQTCIRNHAKTRIQNHAKAHIRSQMTPY